MNRITSLDLLKGLVMVVMALDHTRDYFHAPAFLYDPTNPVLTTFPIFFTRWITHFCAPVFCLLAGISAYLTGRKKSLAELTGFLFKRGLWLVFIELTIVNFAWFFDIYFRNNGIAVIGVLGISMMVLAALIHLPKNVIIIFSCVVIFGHNLLDSFHFPSNFWWSMLHEPAQFKLSENFTFWVDYPVIPWIGVMSLGYVIGSFFSPNVESLARKIQLNGIGVTAIIIFFILRGLNSYGDTTPWTYFASDLQTMYSFFNPDKYPPSLLYLLMTLGPALVFIGISENFRGAVQEFFSVFGRVPFFFYVIHLYLIHFMAMIAAEVTGYGWQSKVLSKWLTDSPELKGFGFPLWSVFLIWLTVIILMYPLCKKFNTYKMRHKEKWWLSYL